MTKALFAGSFDPFTIGHADIVERVSNMFDHVYILIASNSSKTRTFSPDNIGTFLSQYYKDWNISVYTSSKLTTDFALEHKVDVLVRGVRSVSDFEYEKNLALINKSLTGIETIFIPTKPELEHVSSSLVRELRKYNKDFSKYMLS